MAGDGGEPVRIFVIFAEESTAYRSFKKAVALARGIDVGIVVLLPKHLPFGGGGPLPVEEVQDRECKAVVLMRALAAQAEVIVCDDAESFLTQRRIPRSVVVLPLKGKHSFTAEKRFARHLRRMGYIVVDADGKS